MRSKFARGGIATMFGAVLLASTFTLGAAPVHAAEQPRGTARSVTPNGGLPGGNQPLEVFNEVVRVVQPPAQDQSSSLRIGKNAKSWIDMIGAGAGVVGLISGLAFGFTSDKDLHEIINELNEIQNTLNQMQQQLNEIQTSINALTAMITKDFQVSNCVTSLQNLSTYENTIYQSQQSYNTLIANMNKAYANPDSTTGLPNTSMAPSKSDLLAFSANAQSLSGALDGINSQLMLKSTPILFTCAPVANGLVTTDLNAEAAYYSALYELVEREYAMQVQGLQLLLTMNMIDAWAAAFPNSFNPTATVNVTTEDIANVCFPDDGTFANNDVEVACNAATANVARIYDNVMLQMLYAGIPYVWGTDGQVSTQVATSTTSSGALSITPLSLWALDLNDFQATKSDGSACPYPLATSTSNVCGGTVGTTQPFTNSSWQTLNGWRPAATADWLSLLGTGGTLTPTPLASTMEQRGLSVPADYVIYTGEASDLTAGPALWTQQWLQVNKQTKKTYGYTNGLCLLDTNAETSQSQWTSQPFCDEAGGGTLAYLMNTPIGTQKYGFSGLVFGGNMSLLSNWDLTSSSFDWWRYAFYYSGGIFTSTDSSHTQKNGGEYVQANTSDQSQQSFAAPGWASGWNYGPDPSANQIQASPTATFRWPVRSLKSIDCSWRVQQLRYWGIPVVTSSGVNPAGMPTMCTPELVSNWFAQVLPSPEPPTAIQQSDDVSSAPQSIPRSGVTTVLKAGATANLSGQQLRVRVRVANAKGTFRPTGDVTNSTAVKIIRKNNGKVQLQTFGHKHLRITLTYVAKKAPHFKRFEKSYTYRVKR